LTMEMGREGGDGRERTRWSRTRTRN
jgi:hypothetical protein